MFYEGLRSLIYPVPGLSFGLILDRLNAFAYDGDGTLRSHIRSNRIARLLKNKGSGRLRRDLAETRGTGRLA